MAPLDNIDRKLLATLQNEPDLSVHALAERLNLTHTPCWRRLKRLEAQGVIRGRAVILDAASLDLRITVFAALRLKQHDEETLEQLETSAQRCPEILECFSTSGDRDYMLRIVIQSVEHYERFLKRVLLRFPGVASVTSHFALKCVKLTTQLPI
jgi:Lrp/AsnC family transcriptional regulator